MSQFKRFGPWVVLALVVLFPGLLQAGGPSIEKQRSTLTESFNDGDWKIAYDGLRKLALDPKNNPLLVGKDLELALTALRRLGREDEADDFRESVVKVHARNWRLLAAAARTLADGHHGGKVVAGAFQRGDYASVSSAQRDRVRSLQLLHQALAHSAGDADRRALAELHLQIASLLLHGARAGEAWHLQYLTDLAKLPDYEEAGGWWRAGTNHSGAPVDEAGNPVLHHLPKTYADAKSDGERWRWMLARAVELNPSLASQADLHFAGFMRSQLGVQTLAGYGWYFGQTEKRDDGKTGVFALHTLKDDETIANLATGLKRFRIPDEFNWLKICQRVADRARARDVWAEQALDLIAQEYEDRRQYPRAAAAWTLVIKEYGSGQDGWRKRALDQIVGNWGQFETTDSTPAGQPASLDFRFRNAKTLSLEAHAIDVPRFLADVKAYIASKRDGLVDENRVSTANLGARLIAGEEKKYSLGKAAAWSVDLKPRPNHFDERITIKTPLKKPGAYLVKARLADGNLSQILAWVTDTIIVRTEMRGETLYYVADAVTGAPVADATVEFFGWYEEPIAPKAKKYRVVTSRLTKKTNKDGLVAVLHASQFQWLITAVKPKDGPGGADRFAFLGFTRGQNDAPHESTFEGTRALIITDRPVYRPEHTVHFKVWVQHPRYDKPNASEYAGWKFNVAIRDPLGNKVSEQALKADKYGGVAGEYRLPKGAPLGEYEVWVLDADEDRLYASNGFRVEEYKKPEFEVKVDAPADPVKLGDKFTATIEAKYLFGAPVVGAVVKYKILRTPHTAQWFPAGPWDWLYGNGYGWFTSSYSWYPGHNAWGWNGIGRDVWGWPQQQPEVIAEREARFGPGGKLEIVIDTSAAKTLHPNQDHQYSITAEVTDASRRTIVGTGNVVVTRTPFQVHVWLERGHYRVGDTINASCLAHTLDHQPIPSEPRDRGGRARRLEAAAIFIDPADAALAPVKGNGTMTLYRISYNDKNEPVETLVEKWDIATSADGDASLKFKAHKPGQYRLSCKVRDAKDNTVEGAYLFLVVGDGFDGKDFRFNDLEIVPDKKEYAPGDKVKLNINVNKTGSTVLLFVRPVNGYYPLPKVLRLKGKSVVEEIAVVAADMPNFFVEAVTIADGRRHSVTREIFVPPAQRIVKVEVLPGQKEYRPGQKAVVKVKLSQMDGKPFQGSTVVSVYDKSVHYISGGSNVPEIKDFFWQWRRKHWSMLASSGATSHNLRDGRDPGMEDIGLFGGFRTFLVPQNRWREEPQEVQEEVQMLLLPFRFNRFDDMGFGMAGMMMGGMPGMMMGGMPMGGAGPPPDPNMNADPILSARGQFPAPTVRKNFADTAYWSANLVPDKNGIAEFRFDTPDQLTTWTVRAWAMGLGTRVGEGEAEIITRKDLIVRLQAPRFFVQKDEVVLSANVHNYLKADKKIRVSLELDGGTLSALDPLDRDIQVGAGGEQRVDWRVKALREGEAVIRMKAVCDADADAMEMRFPVFVHGMLKTESFTGVLRPDKNAGKIVFNVPAERRPEQSVLELRYSPSLAGAMVDALPYLADYPYGCTEQTLNRFVPTVIAQNLLLKMKLDLKEIEKHRTNLNAGEIGDDKKRVKDWQRLTGRNPVFNVDEVRRMSQAGVNALANQQNTDGGWGWFAGPREISWPHTTAVVVRGLLVAQDNKVEMPPDMLKNGIAWLTAYQTSQVRMLRNAASQTYPWKNNADNLDAMIYMTLVEAGDIGVDDTEMRDFLYRDRVQHLSVYGKAILGLALHKQAQKDKLAVVLRNIEQFLVTDDENQTAYLRLPEGNAWWYWHGDEVEANAYYLKLLARTGADNERASRLVKYLLNNRRHATSWRSTRDTALCVEAFADYLSASGEDRPDMTVEVWLDGQKKKEVRIDKSNLFSFDNKLVLTGDKLTAGKHTIEIKRKGSGRVYFNAYLSYFTLEDDIKRSGLEIKVNRKYYKLTRVQEKVKVSGSRGQALDQEVEKYVRSELKNLATLKSGDLVEVELEIDSKNDYEYLIFEDMKAGGFEPLSVQSGYVPGSLGAYMELRDEKVAFFVRELRRGKHSLSYQLRAETPGVFSALPTRVHALYAPELKGNSDEIKMRVVDR